MKDFDIKEIAAQFKFEGGYQSGHSFGFGHINDTYLITSENGHVRARRYVLQRINHEVFKNPDQVMENIDRVTEHLRKKIIAEGGNPARETLTPVSTHSGNVIHKDVDGNYWRAYLYIENTLAYNNVETLDHAYQGARAFARFQKHLIDFDVALLHETIPDFHHTLKRFFDFNRALETDELNRAQGVQDEIEFVLARKESMSQVVDLMAGKSVV